MSRRQLTWAIGALLTLGLSFSLSYQIFDRQQQAHRWEATISKEDLGEQLRRLALYRGSDFIDAAHIAGFSRSQLIYGTIDLLERLPDGRLHVAGWVINSREPDKTISVFFVIPEKIVLALEASRRRDDVAQALGFPLHFIRPGFDTVFEYRASCDSVRELFVVAVNANREYDFIRPIPGIRGC